MSAYCARTRSTFTAELDSDYCSGLLRVRETEQPWRRMAAKRPGSRTGRGIVVDLVGLEEENEMDKKEENVISSNLTTAEAGEKDAVDDHESYRNFGSIGKKRKINGGFGNREGVLTKPKPDRPPQVRSLGCIENRRDEARSSDSDYYWYRSNMRVTRGPLITKEGPNTPEKVPSVIVLDDDSESDTGNAPIKDPPSKENSSIPVICLDESSEQEFKQPPAAPAASAAPAAPAADAYHKTLTTIDYNVPKGNARIDDLRTYWGPDQLNSTKGHRKTNIGKERVDPSAPSNKILSQDETISDAIHDYENRPSTLLRRYPLSLEGDESGRPLTASSDDDIPLQDHKEAVRSRAGLRSQKGKAKTPRSHRKKHTRTAARQKKYPTPGDDAEVNKCCPFKPHFISAAEEYALSLHNDDIVDYPSFLGSTTRPKNADSGMFKSREHNVIVNVFDVQTIDDSNQCCLVEWDSVLLPNCCKLTWEPRSYVEKHAPLALAFCLRKLKQSEAEACHLGGPQGDSRDGNPRRGKAKARVLDEDQEKKRRARLLKTT